MSSQDARTNPTQDIIKLIITKYQSSKNDEIQLGKKKVLTLSAAQENKNSHTSQKPPLTWDGSIDLIK